MKKCTDYKLLISRLIDSDIDDNEADEVKKHIESCARCNQIFSSYHSIMKLIDESYNIETPYSFTECKPVTPVCSGSFYKNWYFRYAALLVLSVLIISGVIHFTGMQKSGNEYVILEQDALPLMNSPLGTIVYYEKYSDDVILDQFASITRYNSFSRSTVNVLNSSLSYESSLFRDNDALRARELILTGYYHY